MTTNENPAPRANAESRAPVKSHLPSENSTLDSVTPEFAARLIAVRYGLALPFAALVARLAKLGRALA